MGIIIIFFFGLSVGSFLNVVILRLHEGKSILGRSLCKKCEKIIAWHDNIPVISFFLLRGGCRFCKTKLSWQYPLVEASTAILFSLAYLSFANDQSLTAHYPLLIAHLVFISVLIILFVYDLLWYIIPDSITIPAIIVAFALNLFLGYHWISLFIGGIIGGGIFLFQFVISQGRWIGKGDIRLGALMGVIVGWKMLLLALFLSYLSGAIVGLLLVLSGKKKMSSKVPFGTFLSASTIVVLLYGGAIVEWYKRNILF